MARFPIRWHWRQFSYDDIKSKGDGSIVIHTPSLDMLDVLLKEWRDRGYKTMIDSAYRDAMHNARVGGAPRSMHRFGRAFDLACRRPLQPELEALARSIGFTGIGRYNSFLHVDTGPARVWGLKPYTAPVPKEN